MKKILVTGGAGFIGRNLVQALNEKGLDNIIIVDHLGESIKWKNLLGLNFLDYFEKEEFLEILPKFKKDIATVFHLGACSNTTVKDTSYLVKNNFLYSKILAEFCFKEKIPFIYASSAATYGDGSLGFSDDHSLIPKLKPLNPYGFSKQLFDLWLYHNNLLDRAVGLKYFNVYGEYEFHKGEMQSVVLKAYKQIKQTGKVKLFKSYHPDFKDGEQKRDFIYVKDAVKMTLFFMEHPDKTGIYNVGTGKARTFNDLVNAVFKALNLSPSIEYIEMPEKLKKQYQYFTQAEMEKIKKAGYNEKVTELEEGVYSYVRFLEENFEEWEDSLV